MEGKKTTPVTIALVALGSSLTTIGATELVRRARSVPPPPLTIEGPPILSAAPVRGDVPLVLPATGIGDPSILYEDRVRELEQRLLALELGPDPERSPLDVASSATADPGQLTTEADLRSLVLGWVAEDRADRGRAEQVDDEEQRRIEMEFDARHQAMMLAQEHDLPDWQEDEFAKLFLEVGERAYDLEADFDLTLDDPEAVEARWLVFDEWVDQRERALTAQLDPELYEAIYGDED